MKASRTLTATAAFALVAASTLLGATAANAADLYVDAADVNPTETNPYSAEWFVGGGSTGAIATTAGGLNLDATAGLIQVLNGTPITSDLTTFVDGASFTVTSGNVFFQIPVFADGVAGTDYTTLRPVTTGTSGVNTTGDWITSNAFGSLAAGAHPFSDYVDEAAIQGWVPQVLAFGLYASVGENATVASVTADGNTHWFLAAPTATVAPASLTVADVDDTGVTGTFTGFVPGESVQVYVTAGGSSGSILATVAADAAGVVTYTHVGTATAVGSYSLGAAAPTSGINVFAAFAVTANAPVLAATGAEALPMTIGAVLLLLVGGGLVVFTARRRRALSI